MLTDQQKQFIKKVSEDLGDDYTVTVAGTAGSGKKCNTKGLKNKLKNVELYKVYVIKAYGSYTGISLLASVSADEANSWIRTFYGTPVSKGYTLVTEDDALEGVYSETEGFIYKGINPMFKELIRNRLEQ